MKTLAERVLPNIEKLQKIVDFATIVENELQIDNDFYTSLGIFASCCEVEKVCKK